MRLSGRRDEGVFAFCAVGKVEIPGHKQRVVALAGSDKYTVAAVTVSEHIPLFQQVADKFLLRNAQLLGGIAETGHALNAHKGIVVAGLRSQPRVLGLRLFQCLPRGVRLCVFRTELADILRDQLGVLIHPAKKRIRHIRAVLADGGQHLGRHPALELFCTFQLAGEDERVKAGFVDDNNILLSAGGHHFSDPFVLIVNVLGNSIIQRLPLAIAQRHRNVSAHEPRFAVHAQGAQFTELRVFKDHQVVIHIRTSFLVSILTAPAPRAWS